MSDFGGGVPSPCIVPRLVQPAAPAIELPPTRTWYTPGHKKWAYLTEQGYLVVNDGKGFENFYPFEGHP